MRIVAVLIVLSSFAFSQPKEQRFQISKLGTVDQFELTVLLDTQTGKTWQLVKDSVLIEQHRTKLTKDVFYVWKPVFFAPTSTPIAPRYTALPDSTR